MLVSNRKRDNKQMEAPVKENAPRAGVVPLRWLLAAAAATALALAAAVLADRRLPAPLDRSAPPHRFSARRAHDHLVALTALGPRVAGTYENEVLAVRAMLAAARGVAAQASPHNRVDVDAFAASGGFALTFLDGMSTLYRDVQGVVVRVRGAGAAAREPSLLLNCHFDSVPDSPGASDDAAGCAVGLEALRALAAGPPLARPVLLLLNGAEETILQGSHAFVTTHPWARDVRAFINVEACGAGGREVLFQAGPHDPWLLEVYAAEAPHPFASSLAQELFQSGLIPADTDFRIFRDFGNLSGLDFAWSANGYVYHTHLDTAQRVPPAALQRTGDNVLALVRGLLRSERLALPPELAARPLYLDVLGVAALAVRARGAALLLLAALLLVAIELALSARDARRALYLGGRNWAGVVGRATLGVTLSSLAGVTASVCVALALHAAGARLSFFSRPWLLLPLYGAPALVGAWADARHTWGTWLGGGAARLARGWWAWRAWRDATALLAGALAAAGAALGLRSSFLPLLWALPALASLAGRAAGAGFGAAGAAWHAAGAALPALQTAYLALNSVQTFVPIMGRAGTPPLPPDVVMAALVGALTVTAFSWMLPLAVAARNPRPLMWALAGACALAAALAGGGALGGPYGADTPQRLMVLHARRTAAGRSEAFYWAPELDANTARSVRALLAPDARATPADDCARWAYCGAPYFLPVLSLVARGHEARSADEPALRVRVEAALAPAAAARPGRRALAVNVTGAQHVALVLAPAPGGRVTRCAGAGEPAEGPRWGARRTYFVTWHAARAGLACELRCAVEREGGEAGDGGEAGGWLQLTAAGHAMGAPRGEAHERLLRALPAWTAPTGWAVDLHVLEL